MELRKPRVLVIDDERYIRGLLSELLSRWGCQTEVAADGHEALGLLSHGTYDLVLTDFSMPGVTGLQLVETVRQTDRSVGVIMLTGANVDLDGHDRRLGFTLLRKPLEINRLESEVKQALRSRVAV